MAHEISINVHSVIPKSRINGPGKRMVVFFQGCNRGCPGCFNPDTHPFDTSFLCTPRDIIRENFTKDIEGITISGGEPFMQHHGLHKLLKVAREEYNLSTIVYTGYEYGELRSVERFSTCLGYIDLLVDGNYLESEREPTLLARGSTNQTFHFLSRRYTEGDLYMPGRMEIIIKQDGTIIKTGFGRITMPLQQR